MNEVSRDTSGGAGSLRRIAPVLAISRRLKWLPIPRPLARWIRRRMLAGVASECVVDVLGCRMRLHPQDMVDATLLTAPQMYDTREIAFLRRHLNPGDVFLDIGAHIGFYSLQMAQAVGESGTVIAIEATPVTFERLRENVAMNGLPQVRCFCEGVSDKRETLHLALRGADNTGGNSFMFPEEDGIEVACRPLLEFLREAGVESVGAAKLDIEGFEYRVLERFLTEAAPALYPRALVIELNYFQFPDESEKALALLQAHGYRTEATTTLNHMMVLTGPTPAGGVAA